MRVNAWPTATGLLATAAQTTHQPWRSWFSLPRDGGDLNYARGGPPRQPHQPSTTGAAFAFLPPRTPAPSPPSRQAAGRSNRGSTSPPPSSSLAHALKRALRVHSMSGSSSVISAGEGDSLGGAGGITLWLDMRTAVLPAAQTLQTLYDDLRQRELALGRTPEDPDWTLKRVPNPVGALLFAPEPEGRAADESNALGGALQCYELNGESDRVLEVPSGDFIGFGFDPVAGGGGPGAGAAAVAAAQQAGGSVVLLLGVRPSDWEGGDMTTVLQIAASACAGSGKTLVVAVRSVGQLHDTAMAALAASQTQVLGQVAGGGVGGGAVALLIEPVAELWEAGLLYL